MLRMPTWYTFVAGCAPAASGAARRPPATAGMKARRGAGGAPGRDVVRAKRAIGVCTQDDTFDGDFTVEQNLTIAAGYFRPRPTELPRRVAELLERFDLAGYAREKPETLSGGYRRRLMIARALVHRPRLLFLDEPTTGLDPQARMGVWDLSTGRRAEGLGIILTTHYMDEAEPLSDPPTLLARAPLVPRSTPTTL